jgi:Lipid A 3-O-deacylase (PagL)
MTAFARFTLPVLAAVFVLHSIADCQEGTPAKGKWDVSIWIAAATGEEIRNSFAESQILSAGSFIGRILKRRAGTSWWQGDLEYGFSVSPLFLQVRPQRLHGIAFEPIVLRWNSGHTFGRATPYIELTGGAVRTNSNFPAGNTSDFNFAVSGGGGVYLSRKSNQAWDVGAHWSHISNANLGIQNPEFNGVQIRLAYHWYR